jgi:hypothetical protein
MLKYQYRARSGRMEMSTIKEELLAAIEVASDEVLAQTLFFIKKSLNTVEDRSLSKEYPSSLDGLSEFLQSKGFYKDEYIDRCMAEIEKK